LLLLPEPLRFSIDIDIIIDKRPDDLQALFDKIIDQTIFTSWDEDIRDLADHIPKGHYKFYYDCRVQVINATLRCVRDC